MNKIFNLHTNQTTYFLTDLVFSSYQPTCFFSLLLFSLYYLHYSNFLVKFGLLKANTSVSILPPKAPTFNQSNMVLFLFSHLRKCTSSTVLLNAVPQALTCC